MEQSQGLTAQDETIRAELPKVFIDSLPTTTTALRKLTIRERRFIRSYMRLGVLSDSALDSGYSYDYGKDLIRKPRVFLAVQCLIRDEEETADLDRNFIRNRIREVAEACLELNKDGNPSDPQSALRALELLGRSEKTGSIFSDKIQHEHGSHEDFIKELAKRGGKADTPKQLEEPKPPFTDAELIDDDG